MIKKFLNFTKQNLTKNKIFFKFCTNKKNPVESFQYLVRKLEGISKSNSRNANVQVIEDIISEYLKNSNRDVILAMIKLLTCRVNNEEIQIAVNSLAEILQDVFPDENITQYLFQKGDIGLFAREMLEKEINQEISKSDQSLAQDPISVVELVNFFDKLSNLSGDGSRLEKQSLIKDYLKKIRDPLEIQFFIRILSKSLRIGVSDKSIIKALVNLNKKQSNTLDDLLQDIQKKIFCYNIGLESEISVGTPIPPMLAKAIPDFDSLLKFLKKFQSKKVSLELKYDGERSQVHYSKEEGVKIFSRNLEIQNDKYPQLVRDLQEYFVCKQISSCILDGEIVITDSKGDIRSFQDQQKDRRRKNDQDQPINEDIEKVEKIYIFDAIMINSSSLLEVDQESRKNTMRQHFPEHPPIHHAESRELDLNIETDLDLLKAVLRDYIDRKIEGAMVKSLDETTFYDTNGRTQWAKLKKQVLTGGIADTFDVLPIAAYYGKGRRSGVFGAYLLACYDKNNGQYIALCKIGTGFSDNFLQATTERLKSKIVEEKPQEYQVHRTFKPDVWFQSDSEVWEVECDSLSRSPIYTIGSQKYGDTGISLRFPRFIKIRDDKTAKTSTTTDQIIEHFNEQKPQSSSVN